jgi:thiamine biosynthesis lipoprotein
MKNVAAICAVSLATLVCRVNAETITLGGPTMGTSYRVRLVAPNSAAVNAKNLQKDVESLLAEIDAQMSTYRDDSELSRFNRAPAGEWFVVSSATAEVVAAAQEISQKSGGAIDVTVGPYLRLWHFGPKKSDAARAEFEPPSEASIQAAREFTGYEKLEVRNEPPALRKLSDGLEVDLSSIAPGFAVDQIAALLGEHGIDSFIMELGGEIRASGKREDGKPWRVAIERPLVDRREMQMALALSNAAISTAGDYRKFFEHAGRRYSHIIDPSTGRPVEHALASVTVAADTCLVADGWDTALLVMGPQRGFDYAEQHGIAALFILRQDKQMITTMTSGWRKRFGDSGGGRLH